MLKTLVFNGWSAGPEIWDLCTFEHDWVFSYLEQLDGVPDRVIAESDAVILVGFSMGGNYAMRMLLKYMQKIRGAVFISTTPRMPEDKASGWVGMSHRRREALKLGTQIAFRGNSSPLYDADNLERGLQYLDNTDLRAEMLAIAGKTDFPVAILQSERDGIVRPHNAEFLKRVFPQAEVFMIPGNEHNIPVIAPAAIDRAVRGVAEEGQNLV